MNVKVSQLLSISRSYHPYQSHHQHFHQQTFQRFSFQTWELFLSKFKEFQNVTRGVEYFKTFQSRLKIMAAFLGRECSPIFAQRAFRSYRMLQLHSKLWSYGSQNPVTKRALFSFVILTLCKANDSLNQTIKDSELVEHIGDLDFIRELTTATVICPKCKDRLVINKKVNGVQYCRCPDAPPIPYIRPIEGLAWVPFAETADLLIWRKPHPEHDGLYIYKVYGYYNDISAQDFLEAQIDIEYRKIWDDTALQLEIVEKFPDTQSDIIYWEMKWPKMFANRDYLFIRRHKVEKGGRNMVIMSKAVTHPKVPERAGIHRVKEYWSIMHIKAAKGLSQPGVEFGLTYFDHPGVSLPQWLTNWAALTGIPEFLSKQRNAARIKRLQKSMPSKPITITTSKSQFRDKQKSNNPPSNSTVPQSSEPPPENKPDEVVDHVGEVVSKTKPSVDDTTTKTDSKNIKNTLDDNLKKKTINNDILNETASSQQTVNPQANTSTKQTKEEKKELLSQFFKEHILEVHS